MNKNNSELATEKIPKLLLNMSLPAILAQIINLLYNMVDRMFIGRIPDIGALALTGAGLTFPIIILITAFAALVSMGAAPRASIMLGQVIKTELVIMIKPGIFAKIFTPDIDLINMVILS